MKQINSILLFTILLATALIFSGLTLAKGGLYLGKHESDVLHLLDILERLKQGAQIHVDFQTPLGILSFAPILWINSLGLDLGMSFAGAQALLAVVLLPAIWWIGVSRLGAIGAVFFGISILALATAMVDGQIDSSASISVHYNRWAWSLALSALALATLPVREKIRPRPILEGILIGSFMAVLALMKVTYFVGFAVPIIAGLLINKNYRAFIAAFFAGVVGIVLTSVFMGIGFWDAYLGDLLLVAGSENRPFPGASLSDLVAAPKFLAISGAAFVGLVALRQSGQNKEALILLLCMPGFYYVTFQNFGNDPIWLIFLVVYLMANRPGRDMRNGLGWDIRGFAAIVASVALALMAPIYMNILTSQLHHYSINTDKYAPFLPQVAKDIYTADVRSRKVTLIGRVEGDDTGLEGFVDENSSPNENIIGGIEFPECQLRIGAVATVHAISKSISEIVPAQESKLFVADVNSVHWIEGGMVPATGSAPWYYGGSPGFDNAEFLLVPKCAAVLSVRNAILADLRTKEGYSLAVLDETPLHVFFRIDR